MPYQSTGGGREHSVHTFEWNAAQGDTLILLIGLDWILFYFIVFYFVSFFLGVDIVRTWNQNGNLLPRN